MATPRAQEHYEQMYETLGGKPVHQTLATHWARLVELLYAAERCGGAGHRPGDHQQGRAARIPTETPTEGVGVVEAPRGTLTHHYMTDEQRHRHEGQPDRRHDEQLRADLDVGQEGGAGRSSSKGNEVSEGLLNMVEMAFRAYDPCFGCATHSLPGADAARGHGRVRRRVTSSPASRARVRGWAERSSSAWATRSCLTTGSGSAWPDGSRIDGLPAGVEVAVSEVAGLRFLELVRGFTRVIIIDALNSPPGQDAHRGGRPVRRERVQGRAPLRVRPLLGLDTALEGAADRLRHARGGHCVRHRGGRRGTFGEELSPPVAAAGQRGVDLVRRQVGA